MNNSLNANSAKAPIVQIGLGNSASKNNESPTPSFVSIGGDNMQEADPKDPNVVTLDINELSGEKKKGDNS